MPAAPTFVIDTVAFVDEQLYETAEGSLYEYSFTTRCRRCGTETHIDSFIEFVAKLRDSERCRGCGRTHVGEEP